jgi:hypothetical protein
MEKRSTGNIIHFFSFSDFGHSMAGYFTPNARAVPIKKALFAKGYVLLVHQVLVGI